MKKLLFDYQIQKHTLSIRGEVVGFEYSNAFSGLYLKGIGLVKGFCANCEDKYCIFYSESELESKVFKSFPHNTSRRVCPTKAIIKDSQTHNVVIDSSKCICCGLCLHRCPFAAIQLDLVARQCYINSESSVYAIEVNPEKQRNDISILRELPYKVNFKPISEAFSRSYVTALTAKSKQILDISEVVVRNTLLNLGNICNINAQGNNHIRIEFFAEAGNGLIITGESAITNTDTLAITRRILDDIAVLSSRYGFNKVNIVPLSVINGLPNKRTDYYEVIEDIRNVLGITICTITYHILFVLNLYRIRLEASDLSRFIVNRTHNSLLPYVMSLIPNIQDIDKNIDSLNYIQVK